MVPAGERQATKAVRYTTCLKEDTLTENERFVERLEALAPHEGHSDTCLHLSALLLAWRESGDVPAGAGALSGGEYRALVLASGNEALLGRSPVGDFLVLDGWLQKWVLEMRGWSGFIGTRIGK